MISCVPTPAVPGSNAPVDVFVIPVPAQVPPAFTAVSVTAASETQKGPAAFIAASVTGLTVTVTDALFEHPPLVPVTEYVVVAEGDTV
ncbi:hypothetical protein SDC9_112788 [bioreactor metagenome]|uniref:Uncharacterized protein n=1 Tax=bioreactor metagenome TaxID=1076179 RepID=A0A645BVT1_9ZZZZ